MNVGYMNGNNFGIPQGQRTVQQPFRSSQAPQLNDCYLQLNTGNIPPYVLTPLQRRSLSEQRDAQTDQAQTQISGNEGVHAPTQSETQRNQTYTIHYRRIPLQSRSLSEQRDAQTDQAQTRISGNEGVRPPMQNETQLNQTHAIYYPHAFNVATARHPFPQSSPGVCRKAECDCRRHRDNSQAPISHGRGTTLSQVLWSNPVAYRERMRYQSGLNSNPNTPPVIRNASFQYNGPGSNTAALNTSAVSNHGVYQGSMSFQSGLNCSQNVPPSVQSVPPQSKRLGNRTAAPSAAVISNSDAYQGGTRYQGVLNCSTNIPSNVQSVPPQYNGYSNNTVTPDTHGVPNSPLIRQIHHAGRLIASVVPNNAPPNIPVVSNPDAYRGSTHYQSAHNCSTNISSSAQSVSPQFNGLVNNATALNTPTVPKPGAYPRVTLGQSVFNCSSNTPPNVQSDPPQYNGHSNNAATPITPVYNSPLNPQIHHARQLIVSEAPSGMTQSMEQNSFQPTFTVPVCSAPVVSNTGASASRSYIYSNSSAGIVASEAPSGMTYSTAQNSFQPTFNVSVCSAPVVSDTGASASRSYIYSNPSAGIVASEAPSGMTHSAAQNSVQPTSVCSAPVVSNTGASASRSYIYSNPSAGIVASEAPSGMTHSATQNSVQSTLNVPVCSAPVVSDTGASASRSYIYSNNSTVIVGTEAPSRRTHSAAQNTFQSNFNLPTCSTPVTPIRDPVLEFPTYSNSSPFVTTGFNTDQYHPRPPTSRFDGTANFHNDLAFKVPHTPLFTPNQTPKRRQQKPGNTAATTDVLGFINSPQVPHRFTDDDDERFWICDPVLWLKNQECKRSSSSKSRDNVLPVTSTCEVYPSTPQTSLTNCPHLRGTTSTFVETVDIQAVEEADNQTDLSTDTLTTNFNYSGTATTSNSGFVSVTVDAAESAHQSGINVPPICRSPVSLASDAPGHLAANYSQETTLSDGRAQDKQPSISALNITTNKNEAMSVKSNSGRSENDDPRSACSASSNGQHDEKTLDSDGLGIFEKMNQTMQEDMNHQESMPCIVNVYSLQERAGKGKHRSKKHLACELTSEKSKKRRKLNVSPLPKARGETKREENNEIFFVSDRSPNGRTQSSAVIHGTEKTKKANNCSKSSNEMKNGAIKAEFKHSEELSGEVSGDEALASESIIYAADGDADVEDVTIKNAPRSSTVTDDNSGKKLSNDGIHHTETSAAESIVFVADGNADAEDFASKNAQPTLVVTEDNSRKNLSNDEMHHAETLQSEAFIKTKYNQDKIKDNDGISVGKRKSLMSDFTAREDDGISSESIIYVIDETPKLNANDTRNVRPSSTAPRASSPMTDVERRSRHWSMDTSKKMHRSSQPNKLVPDGHLRKAPSDVKLCYKVEDLAGNFNSAADSSIKSRGARLCYKMEDIAGNLNSVADSSIKQRDTNSSSFNKAEDLTRDMNSAAESSNKSRAPNVTLCYEVGDLTQNMKSSAVDSSIKSRAADATSFYTEDLARNLKTKADPSTKACATDITLCYKARDLAGNLNGGTDSSTKSRDTDTMFCNKAGDLDSGTDSSIKARASGIMLCYDVEDLTRDLTSTENTSVSPHADDDLLPATSEIETHGNPAISRSRPNTEATRAVLQNGSTDKPFVHHRPGKTNVKTGNEPSSEQDVYSDVSDDEGNEKVLELPVDGRKVGQSPIQGTCIGKNSHLLSILRVKQNAEKTAHSASLDNTCENNAALPFSPVNNQEECSKNACSDGIAEGFITSETDGKSAAEISEDACSDCDETGSNNAEGAGNINFDGVGGENGDSDDGELIIDCDETDRCQSSAVKLQRAECKDVESKEKRRQTPRDRMDVELPQATDSGELDVLWPFFFYEQSFADATADDGDQGINLSRFRKRNGLPRESSIPAEESGGLVREKSSQFNAKLCEPELHFRADSRNISNQIPSANNHRLTEGNLFDNINQDLNFCKFSDARPEGKKRKRKHSRPLLEYEDVPRACPQKHVDTLIPPSGVDEDDVSFKKPKLFCSSSNVPHKNQRKDFVTSTSKDLRYRGQSKQADSSVGLSCHQQRGWDSFDRNLPRRATKIKARMGNWTSKEFPSSRSLRTQPLPVTENLTKPTRTYNTTFEKLIRDGIVTDEMSDEENEISSQDSVLQNMKLPLANPKDVLLSDDEELIPTRKIGEIKSISRDIFWNTREVPQLRPCYVKLRRMDVSSFQSERRYCTD